MFDAHRVTGKLSVTLLKRVAGLAVKLDAMTRKSFWLAMYLASALLAPCVRSQSNYAALKSAALQQCNKIDPSESQSGLFFNPDGYRSFYVKSECLQRAAVQFRDPTICDQVHRRYSFFSSSWGISSTHCQKLVAEGVAADRAELQKEKQLAATNPVRLKSFHIQRNGNGRDFDIISEFSTGNPHGYRLVFEIVGVREQPILLHSDGYYIDANSKLNLYVRQADVRSHFPEFQLNRSYSVRATAIVSIGMGGPSGYWSDEFAESIFPMRERSQSITSECRF